MIAFLVDLFGTVLLVCLLSVILTVASLAALVCYSLCVVSGKAAQFEEDTYGWRRS